MKRLYPQWMIFSPYHNMDGYFNNDHGSPGWQQAREDSFYERRRLTGFIPRGLYIRRRFRFRKAWRGYVFTHNFYGEDVQFRGFLK